MDTCKLISFLFSFLLMASPLLSQSNDWKRKVDHQILETLRYQKEASCLVVLAEQAHIDKIPPSFTKEERGEFVYRKLTETASNTQANLLEELTQADVSFRSFWLINAIQASMSSEQLARIARSNDVYKIVHDPWVRMDLPRTSQGAAVRNAIEWGVKQIGSDKVWEKGFTGQGTVIGGQDTGYDWTHPAIKEQYRGWNGQSADHNYNWHDAIHELNPLHQDTMTGPLTNPCGLDVNQPCDDGDHGTHTMGTMVGDDGMGNQIGVAPEAQWIGCRNMDRGYGKPSTYLECFQWFLAPTDLNNENPDPGKAPHVINNSWSCPEMEGCNDLNFDILQAAIHNLRMAGVVVVVSAGNNGFGGCGSVNAPPSMFEESFAVGATNSVDTLAAFSSVGPVTVDSSFREKPNVSAPGVWVRSCVPGNEYGRKSGTSMAGPHVAGAVALMISARPQIAGNVDSIESLLEITSSPAWPSNFAINNLDCDDYEQFPNLFVGHGRIDVEEAVNRLTTISSTNQTDLKTDLLVSPNPFSSILSIRVPARPGAIWNARILSVDGVKIWERNGLTPITGHEINLSHLPPGIYYMELYGNAGTFTRKLVKM